MPATRPHLDRDAKHAEILDAAEALLLRDGYDATAMAAIARRAGVANAAVYWYFPSKDDVLAAVLQRRQERAVASPEFTRGSLDERVVAMLGQLDEVANLTAAVHERSNHSAAVAEVHSSFHAAAERLLQAEFRTAGLSAGDARRGAAALMAVVEGIHLHERQRDPAARNELVLWTLHRLLGA
jgi:AcrR family transcriptional regulator